MKKILVILFALSLMPGALVLAQDGGGRRSDEGNGGKSGSGSGVPSRKHSRGPKNHKNPGGRNNGGSGSNSSSGGSWNGNASDTMPHHFSSNQPENHAGNGFSSPQNNSNHAGGSFNHSGRVPSNLRQMGIRHMPAPLSKSRMLTADPQHSSIVRPQVGPRGQVLNASVIAPTSTNAVLIRNNLTSINHSPAVMAQINIYNNHETVAGRYYWHNWNGTNYCHYYDSWGYHWYGWYWGNTCFWSRWYGNNWWWYDPGYARWCYWYDGYWWWQDPYQNVVYVYNNGEYDSTAANGAPVAANGASAPAGPSAEVDYKSTDGSRMVKVLGDDAFLYDTVDTVNNKPFYLASGVNNVKFSDTNNGQPLQIMLTFNNGTTETFDSDGNPINNGSSAPSH